MDKRKELIDRRNAVIQSGSGKNGSSARERINLLFDEGSFIETDMFSGKSKDAANEGVITGYGTVDSRSVFVYANEGSSDGAFGKEQAKKILKTLHTAESTGAPVVALLDSCTVKLDDKAEALNSLGMLYSEYAKLSGAVLTVSALFGTCAGGCALVPALSDFVIMTKKSRLMLNGEALCRETGRDGGDISSPAVNSEINGNADFTAEDDNAAIAKIKELISLLPGCAAEHAPKEECTDDLNRLSDVFENKDATLDDVIKAISDNGTYLPVSEKYADAVKTGFIKINGETIAVVAGGNEFDTSAFEKAVKMIKFADAFNIPILTLCEAEGFKASLAEERGKILKSAASLSYAYSSATVPKVTLITKSSCTSAGIIMGSKAVGADFVIAWPEAVIGTMSPDMATVLLYGKNGVTDKDTIKNSYIDGEANALAAASTGYIDDVIEPETTRPRLAAAFEMLYTKNRNVIKKHSGLAL